MKTAALKLPHNFWPRLGLLFIGMAMLVAVYTFQRINAAGVLGQLHPNVVFVINRTTRLILNDLACFLIILALFRGGKYLKIAFWLFLVELFVILPFYFLVKLSMEGDSEISSPLLSHVHRLIVNPMLMILLIGGFLYQQRLKR